ncbi:PPOX class F420-dependent enzyme [Haladaptatus sp. R4]|uniref:PPOX class F420-dependent oxidoreductase n=1 Tax=Haladaptatus sp. R4 TaxID=1679489 RepID=UPI0007B46F11|nr:PPOX class F420-dependent oxidoreductase [Haladaptatus sp. R4]KZN24284.1 PPOX class F420-dependent enzyme [Haladaptatus sp. R4]
MESIPEEFRDLFERKAFANFATVMPDGTPQVTPVWVGYDGDYLLVNTAEGRQKERNVRRNPKVGLSILDPDDPYRFVSVRGEVEAVTEDGAVEHANELTKRYMGQDEYPNLDQEEGARVIIRIRPDRVVTGG